ncbi:MAG: glycosyltransferase family 2 protein [Solirubrobacteraceae bacterium]
MQKNTVALSIVVPVFNEEKNLPILCEKLKKICTNLVDSYEIILVNDGSKDNSFAVMKKLSVENSSIFYVNLSRNFGHQIAVTAGLEKTSGEAVVIIDADLQDPPELIQEMYKKYKLGYEVVYAKRNSRKGETFLKKITANYFYKILNKITNINIPLNTGDFRLIDHKIVHYLKKMPEQNKFLRGQIAWLGFRQTEVLFDRDERLYGKTNYTYGKMFKLAIDAITSFSNLPLQLVTRLGFMISFLSFLIILFAFYSHFILERTMTGWTSIIISSTFIGGIQLFVIGIIGEYLARINTNVLNRPLYIVDETNIKSNNI